MPDLAELIQTDRVAVLTMEIQRGIVGDLSYIPALQKVVHEAGMIPNTQRVVNGFMAIVRTHLVHMDAPVKAALGIKE